MARASTGRPVGRQPVYTDADRPHTVSLRISADLHTTLTRYAATHRQTISELLLDGLRWRLSADDPRDLDMTPPRPSQGENGFYGNTALSPEPTTAAMLQEIREQLQVQSEQLQVQGAQLQTLLATLQPRPVVHAPRRDTVIQQNTLCEAGAAGSEEPAPVPVVVEPAPVVASDTSAQQLVMPDKAALVARLHQMRASGLSLSQIAGQLQAEGLPTLSGKGQWQKGTVDKLLRSQANKREPRALEQETKHAGGV